MRKEESLGKENNLCLQSMPEGSVDESDLISDF